MNWRAERNALRPILDRQSGVVRVFASANGPLPEFAAVLRSDLEQRASPRPWLTFQFDPVNSNTKYFGEILRQIEKKLGLDPTSPQPIAMGEGSKLASDISAQQVSIVNSFNFGDGDYERTVRLETRAKSVLDLLRQQRATRSFAFFFLESNGFERRDLAMFRDLLWDAGLEELARDNVLLVDLTRRGHTVNSQWPPVVDVDIAIADEYDEASRGHIREDLARFLTDRGLEIEPLAADAYARAVLDHHRSAATLYSYLAGLLASRR